MRKRWMYLVEELPKTKSPLTLMSTTLAPKDYQAWINVHGAEGWRLIGGSVGGAYVVFEREFDE